MSRHRVPGAPIIGLAALVLAWLIVGTAAAHAATDDCGQSSRRWVAVRLYGPEFSPELADLVLTDLRAEVRRHGIEACPADTQGLPPPIVTLEIDLALRRWLLPRWALELSAGAAAISQTALALYVCGELWVEVALGRVRLRASAGAGAPLRGVTADDSGVPVGGARGLELHGQAGLVLGL